MSRYQPSSAEQEAIDLLRLAGYTVVRQRTYSDLLERVRVAECYRDMEIDRRKSAEAWAIRECDEQRRLTDRLNEVIGFAYEHGATYDDLARFNRRIEAAKAALT